MLLASSFCGSYLERFLGPVHRSLDALHARTFTSWVKLRPCPACVSQHFARFILFLFTLTSHGSRSAQVAAIAQQLNTAQLIEHIDVKSNFTITYLFIPRYEFKAPPPLRRLGLI